MLNVRLRYDENEKLPVTNDFRQISIIKDPIIFGTDRLIKSNTAFSQLTTLTLSAVGGQNYIEDEVVYQGVPPSTTFTGIVVAWNGSNQLKLANTTGSI
jgi:hypothetical protein